MASAKQNVSIMCVDDDAMMLKLYGGILKPRFSDVRFFETSQEAIDSLNERPAQIVILDLNIGGRMSGIDVCRDIRRNSESFNTSVIIVSSHDSESCIVEGYSSGADDYITKPFKHTEFLAKISIAISKKMTSSPALLRLFPGTIFAGRYEIIESLGSGSYGTVFKARDLGSKPHREVALKIFDVPASKINDQTFIALFLREAYGLSKLDHPNIIKLYDIGTTNFYYISMEYLTGRTLEDHVKKYGPMAEGAARSVTYELAKVLRHLADKKLVHRDIKPVNIMITDDGLLKLLDFGLARYENENTLTGGDAFRGTPEFAAPESIYCDSEIDIMSDIFSVGATIYYIVTGVPPFTGKNPMDILKNRMQEFPTPVLQRSPYLSVRFAKLIDQMLSEDKENRPDVTEVISTLENME